MKHAPFPQQNLPEISPQPGTRMGDFCAASFQSCEPAPLSVRAFRRLSFARHTAPFTAWTASRDGCQLYENMRLVLNALFLLG